MPDVLVAALLVLQALADQVAKLEAGVAQTKQVLDAFKEAGLKVGTAWLRTAGLTRWAG